MARYINADALNWRYIPLTIQPEEFVTKSDIEKAPTTDVVEVVRCKDCHHLEILNGENYYARCKQHGRLFDSFGNADTRTWFCADGERRTDDAEVH